MTEEFIPRDTPIYCFVANNPKDKDRARQTRDVWTKRWGFTNFIIQERINSTYFLYASKKFYDHSYGVRKFNEGGKETSFNHSANLVYLIEKIKNKNQHSIIIQSHTILQNDLPKDYLNNDISFFKINKNGRFDMRNGMMVSQKWCRSFDNYLKSTMTQLPTVLDVDSVKKLFNSEYFQLFSTNPHELTSFLTDCKHNLQSVLQKTPEEMHASTV